MSGRRRKGRNFTHFPATVPCRPISPLKAQRAAELWLIVCFTGTLWLHWRERVDALGTQTMAAAVAGPAISKKEVAEIFADEEMEDGDGERPPTIAMLLAGTRWTLGLDLSRFQAEALWSQDRRTL